MFCIKFFKGLLSGKVNSPENLLTFLNFKVPHRLTRSFVPFFITFCSTNYIKNEPIRHLMLIANGDLFFNL